MTWVKIDDNFPDHPKVMAAGGLATLLFIEGLCYSARYLTDGFVPQEAIPRLVDLKMLDLWYQGGGHPFDVAEQLVKVGLWEYADGGYLIHDYLDYNPSGEQVKAMREARAEAGRRGGIASGKTRQQASDEAKPKQTPSKTEAKVNPVPVPVPVPMYEESVCEEGTQEHPANAVADATPATEHLPEKPPRKRKPATPKTPPPAGVQAFRANANRYPPKAWYSDIASTVGEQEADLKRWGAIVKAWVGKGWNPGNVTGMLDCYRRGEIPGNNGPAGQSTLDRSLDNIEQWVQERQNAR